MQAPTDSQRFAVLYVDDEEKSLKGFARAFGQSFRIMTAASARAGLELLQAHKEEIGILMTDQRMPGERGVWLLEQSRHLNPRLIRILVTAFTDMEAAVEAVNTGKIYMFIQKPWDPRELEQTLRRALESYAVQRERDQLLKEKMAVLHNWMIADRIVSLGLLAAGLSHHIRNAMVAVKTFVDLAPAKMIEEKLELEAVRNPEFWKDYHQNVQGQIQKINSLLTEVGAASEISAPPFADEVSLRAVVMEVLATLKDNLGAHQIQVDNQISDALPRLKVDRAKFIKLFKLLLKDEIINLPAGSQIIFTALALAPTKDQSSQIEIQMIDNGPGLANEAVRFLFNPFVVRKDNPAEYGINLMTCYFIVHYHGGQIQARSEGGNGTTFTIRLPINLDESRPTAESPELLQKALLNEIRWERLAAE